MYWFMRQQPNESNDQNRGKHMIFNSIDKRSVYTMLYNI